MNSTNGKEDREKSEMAVYTGKCERSFAVSKSKAKEFLAIKPNKEIAEKSKKLLGKIKIKVDNK